MRRLDPALGYSNRCCRLVFMRVGRLALAGLDWTGGLGWVVAAGCYQQEMTGGGMAIGKRARWLGRGQATVYYLGS